jgi:hypothetical protein
MRKPRRVLVGLKILETAVELTDLACRLAAHRASVFLVHLIELPDNTPLNALVPNLDAKARKNLACTRTSGST